MGRAFSGQVAVTGVFSLAGGGIVAMAGKQVAGNALEGTAESIASYAASGAPITPAGLITTAASGAAISVGTMGVMSKVNLPTIPTKKLGNETPYVDLASPQRRTHILDGDGDGGRGGGGHRWPGAEGKTPFPKDWSDDKIMHEVSDIATDPTLQWQQQTGPKGADFTKTGQPVKYVVDGVRDDVGIRVVIQPSGEGIITGFPVR